jgi:hypothetical protein
MNFRYGLLMSALLLVSLLIGPASAQTIDQSNDVTRGPVANSSDFGQSFTPSMGYLYRVDLGLDSDFSNSKTYEVTIFIRESWDGPNLGSAKVSVPPGVSSANIGEFVSFIFDPPLALNPEHLYIIIVPLSQYFHAGGTNDMIHWHVADDGNTYARGQAYGEGSPMSDDMVFRTFGGVRNVVGGVVMPTNTLAILAPYLSLAGLVVAVSAVVAVKKRRD